jgi:SAM-dependent methyltransferase
MPAEIRTDAEGHEFELRPVACPICRVDAARFIGYRGGKYHRYGSGIVTRIVRCRRCGLVYVNPFPFPRHPNRLYGDPAKYFERHDEDAKVTRYGRLIREARSRLPDGLSSILDVGSGRGELLAAASRQGVLDTVGLEFSDEMIRHARERHGVVVVASTIERYAASTDRTFDLVVLNAVLEHVYDPDAMVESAARLTRPGGLLYIDVPQDPNLVTFVGNCFNRLRGSRAVFNLSPTWPPYHVFGFTRRSIATLLEKHAFAIDSLKVFGGLGVPHRPDFKDRARALAARQIGRVANATGTASNMFIWARRRGAS